jgi:hypothetical protein
LRFSTFCVENYVEDVKKPVNVNLRGQDVTRPRRFLLGERHAI